MLLLQRKSRLCEAMFCHAGHTAAPTGTRHLTAVTKSLSCKLLLLGLQDAAKQQLPHLLAQSLQLLRAAPYMVVQLR
jgi:hypothetical protein